MTCLLWKSLLAVPLIKVSSCIQFLHTLHWLKFLYIVSYAYCISPWYSCYAPSSSCIHSVPVLRTVKYPCTSSPTHSSSPWSSCPSSSFSLWSSRHTLTQLIFTTFLSCSQAVPLVFLFFSFSPRMFRIQGAHGLSISLTIPTLFLVPLHILVGEQFLSMAAGLPGLSPPSLPTL